MGIYPVEQIRWVFDKVYFKFSIKTCCEISLAEAILTSTHIIRLQCIRRNVESYLSIITEFPTLSVFTDTSLSESLHDLHFMGL